MGLMEKEMLICAVLIFITGGKQGVGSVSIRSCNTNMLDIRENTVNSIFCEGFNSSATIEWSVKKGTNANRPVATCDPSTCTVHAPVHFGARRSFNESHLTYLQYDRDVDRSANIVCESTSAGTATSASCALNVISWAVLTNCFIAYNSSLQKLVFSCEYAKAYSSIKSHSCTWFKKSQRGHTKFTGTIFRTYVSLRYTKGKCTLSLNGIGSWTPGKYIYSILFYPSSGEKIVSKGNMPLSTTTTTPTPTTTTTTTTTITTTVTTTSTATPTFKSTTVKDCEKNKYGPDCLETCGRCAGNQPCNSSTGHCPDCLDGWTPPLCTKAEPEEPLLTPTQQAVVGVAAGVPMSWAFIATLVQICQILGNAGWMPFLSLGGKGNKNEEEDGKDAGDSSDEEVPPSKCSRFLKCIFCGGAGVCLLSVLFCISCGRLMSDKFTWQKEKATQNDAESKQPESPPTDPGMTEELVQETPPREEIKDSASIIIFPTESYKDENPSSSSLYGPQESSESETSQSHLPKTDRAKFTSEYLETANWLKNPISHNQQ